MANQAFRIEDTYYIRETPPREPQYEEGLTIPGRWVDGVEIPNGLIILVPYDYGYIGIYDPATNQFRNGVTNPIPMGWDSGYLTPDGRIIFVPLSTATGSANLDTFAEYDYANDELILFPNNPIVGSRGGPLIGKGFFISSSEILLVYQYDASAARLNNYVYNIDTHTLSAFGSSTLGNSLGNHYYREDCRIDDDSYMGLASSGGEYSYQEWRVRASSDGTVFGSYAGTLADYDRLHHRISFAANYVVAKRGASVTDEFGAMVDLSPIQFFLNGPTQIGLDYFAYEYIPVEEDLLWIEDVAKRRSPYAYFMKELGIMRSEDDVVFFNRSAYGGILSQIQLSRGESTTVPRPSNQSFKKICTTLIPRGYNILDPPMPPPENALLLDSSASLLDMFKEGGSIELDFEVSTGAKYVYDVTYCDRHNGRIIAPPYDGRYIIDLDINTATQRLGLKLTDTVGQNLYRASVYSSILGGWVFIPFNAGKIGLYY